MVVVEILKWEFTEEEGTLLLAWVLSGGDVWPAKICILDLQVKMWWTIKHCVMTSGAFLVRCDWITQLISVTMYR